ncbi:MAG: tRNA (adenosine(37)-N6)-dimethylallyltransferase MiaA [Holosporaceae bacterium]|nr:tRNA (adenosine(37)-N6)-dimethylallyltransferase MiaA [Holosporaceae bacterium]
MAPHLAGSLKKLIIIAGPTAVGKSDLAVRCAGYLRDSCGVESGIINADSVQLYDELKILTAYPSDESLARVEHYLYGVLSPRKTSSVNFWLDSAGEKIRQLNRENKVAIVCGGTGLYIGALMNGISAVPSIPTDFRSKVQEKFQQMGRDAFFDLLQTLDPDLCKTLHKNNTQRILRAYEVVSHTGKPLSVWWKEGERRKDVDDEEIFSVVLLPPRENINERCMRRIKKMMEGGAVGEVGQFIEKYPMYNGPLGKVIGYREILSLLDGKISVSDCMQLMFIKTKQYAKRQSVWFRHQMKATMVIANFGHEVEIFFKN